MGNVISIRFSEAEVDALKQALLTAEYLTDEERKHLHQKLSTAWREWYRLNHFADQPISERRVADVLAEQFGRQL